MKIRLTSFLVLFLCVVFISPVQAGSKTYIYRKRANWVKIVKLSNKQLAGQTLNHPYTNISNEKMTAMLQSLQMNKGQIFKKGLKTSEIFNTVEARKFAPYIVQALAQAGPNEVVNLAIVHNRALFVIRNDFITMINVFAKEDGIHFYFSKLFAKLTDDYQQASHIDESIRRAKSIRVSLQANPGQFLTSDGEELVLDPNFDFVNNVAVSEPEVSDEVPNQHVDQQTDKKSKMPKNNLLTQDNIDKPGQTTITSRLQTLEDLKKSNLITQSEYEKKRAEILNGL